MREYKVIIINKDSGNNLAVRVKDECNFLPVKAMQDKIVINEEVYIVWEVTFIIDNDLWIQEIIVKNPSKLKEYNSIGGLTK